MKPIPPMAVRKRQVIQIRAFTASMPSLTPVLMLDVELGFGIVTQSVQTMKNGQFHIFSSCSWQ
jgi:hypothetical protein